MTEIPRTYDVTLGRFLTPEEENPPPRRSVQEAFYKLVHFGLVVVVAVVKVRFEGSIQQLPLAAGQKSTFRCTILQINGQPVDSASVASLEKDGLSSFEERAEAFFKALCLCGLKYGDLQEISSEEAQVFLLQFQLRKDAYKQRKGETK